MASGTSYNGWPANDNKAAISVVQHPIYSGGLKAGDVTTVLQYVHDQFNARVEKVIPDHCWGYAWKTNANNPSQLSCHASGTAIDVNAPAHPNGKGGTFSSAQVKTIEAILAECQGAVSWLKGYDEMHFEIKGNAAKVAEVAKKLGGAKPPAATTPPPTSKDWFSMASEADLRRIVADEIKKNNTAAAAACWDTVMPSNVGGKPEVQQPGKKVRQSIADLLTLANRTINKI